MFLVNTNDMEQVVFDSNFKWQGNFTKSNDYVGEGLGGNYDQDKQGSAWEIFNFSNALKLFGDDSPHSTYKCTSHDDAKCGG